MAKNPVTQRRSAEADRVVTQAAEKVRNERDPLRKGRYAADLRSAQEMRRSLRSTLSR